MRRSTLFGALALFLLLSFAPQRVQAAPPGTQEELVRRHALAGKTPEGALKLWFEACFAYMDPATRDQGRKMLQYLSIPLKGKDAWDSLPSNGTFVQRMKDPGHAHIFRSYARGASPANGYLLNREDWALNVERKARRPGDQRGLQVFLRSGGADSPRPVYMKQSTTTGLWYVNLWANVYVGIRPPAPKGESFQ